MTKSSSRSVMMPVFCRFNTSVQFGLPDEACRAQILHQYAKHLSAEEVASVAEASPGMAGRDLKDISEQAERRWASKVRREKRKQSLRLQVS